jgi:hypothetical protein
VIRELGFDTSDLFTRPVSAEVLTSADVVVAMGLSVGVVETREEVRREDWRVGDPVGATIEEARRVRNDIERRVRTLLDELGARSGLLRSRSGLLPRLARVVPPVRARARDRKRWVFASGGAAPGPGF